MSDKVPDSPQADPCAACESWDNAGVAEQRPTTPEERDLATLHHLLSAKEREILDRAIGQLSFFHNSYHNGSPGFVCPKGCRALAILQDFAKLQGTS